MILSRREFVTGLSALVGLETVGCRTVPKVYPNPVIPLSPKVVLPPPPVYQGRGKALIVNGDAFGLVHIENVVRATKFFLGIGYEPEDITVLSAPYESLAHKEITDLHRTAVAQGFQLPPIAGPATSRNVEASLERMLSGPTVKELFVYITGHGGEEEKKSSHIGLNRRVGETESDKLIDTDLARWLQKARFENGIVIADGCNGEGFARNIGSDKVVAFVKSKYGQTDPCAYFTENFFNAPWRPEADQNKDGLLTLREALIYTHNLLLEGGAPSEFILEGGSYDPSFNVTDQRDTFWPGTFPVFLPKSDVSFAPAPPDYFLYGGYYKRAVYVDSEKEVRKAIKDKNARFYFMADGCPPCNRLRSYFHEILEETKSMKEPKVYVVPAHFNDADKKFLYSNRWAEEIATALGIEGGWPRFVKRIEGKIVLNEEGIPEEPYTYGNLPDQSVLGISKEKLKSYLT